MIHEPLQRIRDRFLNRSHAGDLIEPDFAQKMNLSERIRQLVSEPLVTTAREEHRSGLNTGLYPYAMEITN